MQALRKYMVGLDIYERHSIISRILTKGESKSVIDVGGTSGLLQMFLNHFEVIALNIDDSGDVRYAGNMLPYEDNFFDAVVSLDTLEHIPHQDRKGFVEEMLRVAKKEVIFCTPLGTELHRTIEIELNDAWRREFGEDHRFLMEHIDNGLPTLSEITKILAGKNYDLLFVGDIRLAARLFRNYMRMLKHSNPLVRRFFVFLGLSSSFIFYFLKVTKEPDKFTNRVYAHIMNAN